jgi:Na+-transporting methylmalonyl-CoA/oxaloacetate decarboxylase gamma subunit
MRNLTVLSWLLTAILAVVSIAATAMRLPSPDDQLMLALAIGVLLVACAMLTSAVVTRRLARRRLEALETTETMAAVTGERRQRLAALIAAEKASGDVAAH